MIKQIGCFLKDNTKAILIYSACFFLLFLAAFGLIFANGKTLIFLDDTISGIPNFGLKKGIVRDILTVLLEEHRISIPLVNYNLTNDNNLFVAAGHFPLRLLYYLPNSMIEGAYVANAVIDCWLAGISFFIYAKYNKADGLYAILGSLVYVFCGYFILNMIYQPGFLRMGIYFPIVAIGADRIIRKKQSLILCLGTFMIVVCGGVHILWYCVVALAVYCLCRVLFNKSTFKERIVAIEKLTLSILTGTGLYAFFIIPYIIGITNTSRVGSGAITYKGSWITYGIQEWLYAFEEFFIYDRLSSCYSFYGFMAIIITPIVFFYLYHKEDLDYKVLFPLTIVLMNFPAFGRVAGMSSVNNRWCFLLPFVVAFMFTKGLPELLHANGRKKTISLSLSFGFLIIYFSEWIITKQRLLGLETLMILVGLVGIIIVVLIHDSGERYCGTVVFMCMLALTLINSFHYEDKNYVQQYFLERGNLEMYYSSFIDSAASYINDESFYRVEKSECPTEVSCNLPFWYGYNGISSFTNVIHPEVYDYYFSSGNVGIWQPNKASDLDGRITDELLAGVKYYLCPADFVGIPYGFDLYKNKVCDGQYSIYCNKNALPIGYAYNKYIKEEAFDSLDIAKQQEVMLKAVVLQDHQNEFEESEDQQYQPGDLKSSKLEYTITSQDRSCYENGMVDSLGENGVIELQTLAPGNSEIYITLSNVSNRNSCNITASSGKAEDHVNLGDPEYVYSNHQKYVVLNMGVLPQGKADIKISFSSCVHVDKMCIFARPLDTVENDVSDLRRGSLDDIVVLGNHVGGNTLITERGWMCFSIPYSSGWRCYVDGTEIPIKKANKMYMAISVLPGEHHIDLYYYPVGRLIGWLITVAFATALIFYEFYYIKTR